VVDIRSPVTVEPEESDREAPGEIGLDGKPVKKPKLKRARKHRTRKE